MTTSTALPEGNAAAGLAALLTGLGLRDSSTRDLIEELVNAELQSRGITGTLVSVRYGVATIACDPHHATFARYDADHILAAVNEQLPCALTDLRISSRSVAAAGARR
ncbi:hypothetical protein [Paenarthrobacter sp. C1]|uniref:hypothetical protein n=1 Tax=Paenarthrobacter sp. C1 TaxID=3400220 RepID=UPI003BF57657